MSGCICGADRYNGPHAVNCPRHPHLRVGRAPRVVIRGESPNAVVTIGPPDLVPAWDREDEGRWKFEQES